MMKKIRMETGQMVELKFFVMKDEEFRRSASKEEFYKLLPTGENSGNIRELIECLSSGKVYTVGEFSVCNGPNITDVVYTYISTRKNTFVARTWPGGGNEGEVDIVIDGEEIASIPSQGIVKIF